jgi:hypothetical protein
MKALIAGVSKAHSVPVIRESHEKKVSALFNILGHAMNERNEKRKLNSLARKAKYQATIEKAQLKRQRQNKDMKKRTYANLQREMAKPEDKIRRKK